MRTVEERQNELRLKRIEPKKSKMKIYGWDVFIPVFDNESVINKLSSIEGVTIHPNFRENNCDYCGEFFYCSLNQDVRFCSDSCRSYSYRLEKTGRRPTNKRGRPKKNKCQ